MDVLSLLDTLPVEMLLQGATVIAALILANVLTPRCGADALKSVPRVLRPLTELLNDKQFWTVAGAFLAGSVGLLFQTHSQSQPPNHFQILQLSQTDGHNA
jgi:hypothetical protein